MSTGVDTTKPDSLPVDKEKEGESKEAAAAAAAAAAATAATVASGSDKKTLFVSGFPSDIRPREVHNFFRFLPGFVTAVLSVKRAPIAFVTFASAGDAQSAQTLLTGQHFDLDSPTTLRLEYAKSATHAPTTNTAAGGAASASGAAAAANKKRSPHSGGGATAAAGTGTAVSPAADSDKRYRSSTPVTTPPPPGAYYPPSPYAAAGTAAAGSPDADPRKPCTTLFVASLPPNVTEAILSKLFATIPGFKRCKLSQKATGAAVAFVEYADVQSSSHALNAFHEHRITPSDKHGLRVEYARASMGAPAKRGDEPAGTTGQAYAQHAMPYDQSGAAAAAAAAANNAAIAAVPLYHHPSMVYGYQVQTAYRTH